MHHVGLYVGAGRIVNAPTFGTPVQVAYMRWFGDDYLGATRPAAGAGSIRPVPVPNVLAAPPVTQPAPLPPAPAVFLAPPVQAPAAEPVEVPEPSTSVAAPGQAPPVETASPTQAAAAPTATAPTATAPAVRPPAAPSTTPTTPTPTPAPPSSSAPAPAPVPSTPPIGQPTALTLPGGTTLRLVRTPPDATGLPPPAAVGTANLWIRTPDTGPATIVLVLAPGGLTSSLAVDATTTLLRADGSSTSHLVRTRATMTAAAAASMVSAPSTVVRMLLLATDPVTGQVMVVHAAWG